MLEFYHLHHLKQFESKAKYLANEIKYIFDLERIVVVQASENAIPVQYRENLSTDLFKQLNDFYHTIRVTRLKKEHFLKKYLPESKKIPNSSFLFADFFSGVGGLSQGLTQAGFTPAFVNDHYAAALETYYFNHQLPADRFYLGDIETLVENAERYRPLFKEIQLVAGAPPCQSFSMANRWQSPAEDPRNELYQYFLKMLQIIQPQWFIIENVEGIKRIEQNIKQDVLNYTQSNYHFVDFVVNAKDFGIPQNRKRYFLIGSLAKSKSELQHIVYQLETIKQNRVRFALKDALFGLPPLKTNPFSNQTEYDSDLHGFKIKKMESPQNDFLDWINPKESFDNTFLLNHKSRFNNENDVKIFGLLQQGENSTAQSIQPYNKYLNRAAIFKDKYYKLKEDAFCKTITSHMENDCHMYIHPTQARGLSPREAARVQTFPDNYFFRGSIRDWYKQIGNAVPVKLAEVIGKEIIKIF
jgi:DNA (cytosine-5)-methyltransferase 1